MGILEKGDKVYCVNPNGTTFGLHEYGKTYIASHLEVTRTRAGTRLDDKLYTEGIGDYSRARHFKKYTNYIPGIGKPAEQLILEALIQNDKNIAMEVMNKLSAEAVLCGGAPRDWQFNRVAKDLDIYIGGPKCLDIQYLIETQFGVLDSTKMDCYDEDKDVPDIFEVHEFEYRGKKIQLIRFNYKRSDPVELFQKVITTFDFGICKIGMLRNGDILQSGAFLVDQRNKTLTVDMAAMQARPASVPKRFEKMQEYFPDHKIVVTNREADKSNPLGELGLLSGEA